MNLTYAFYLRHLMACILAIYASTAGAVTVHASSITGLRDLFGEPEILMLDFQAVKKFPGDLEDRTIAHFDIATLGTAPRFAKLIIPLRNFDEGGADGTFNVFSFAGDGVVSADEWDSGRLFRRFTGLDQPGRLDVDVTELVVAALASGDRFVSFAYRTGAIAPGQEWRDRWVLGSLTSLPDSTVVVPIPSALSLILTAILLAVSGAIHRSWPGFSTRRQHGGDLAHSWCVFRG